MSAEVTGAVAEVAKTNPAVRALVLEQALVKRLHSTPPFLASGKPNPSYTRILARLRHLRAMEWGMALAKKLAEKKLAEARARGWRAKAPKRWIQHAVRHPGALRNAVLRIYGRKAGFDGQGRIRCSVLRELAAHPVHGARARLALRLRGFVGVVCPVGGR